jgi:hypothetical protein
VVGGHKRPTPGALPLTEALGEHGERRGLHLRLRGLLPFLGLGTRPG